MKKELVLIFSVVFLFAFVSLVVAENDSSNNSDNLINNDSDEEHSNLISSNYNNENKTEDKEDDFNYTTQIREQEREKIRNESHDWKELIKEEKHKIKSHYENKSECPNNCSCTGSTVKCFLENGTREMTIYAGKSGNIIIQFKDSNMSTNVTLYKSDEGKLIAIFKNESKEIMLPDKIREKARDRLKHNCSEQCNLTLNENGEYEVQTEKKARLLFLLPVKEKTQLQIDAESGEVVKEKSNWWGFLAKDVQEETNSISQ